MTQGRGPQVRRDAAVPVVCLALTLAAGLWARFFFAAEGAADPVYRTPDEPMYTAYSAVLAHEGLVKGTRISVEQYNLNPKIQIYPPPTRVGYLAVNAAVMRALGREDLTVGLELSGAVSALSLVLVALMAWRFFGPWAAVLTALLLSFSPLELALSRKAWQDGLMTLSSAAVLWCAFEILRAKRPLPWIAAFALAGCYATLVKESGAVYVALLGAVSAGVLTARGRVPDAAWTALAAAGAVLAAVGALAWFCGGAGALAEVSRHFTESLPRNEYVRQFQSGPWWSLPAAMWLLSPVSAALGAAGLTLGWRHPPTRAAALAAALVLMGFAAAVSWPEPFKNLRFLAPVVPAFYLTAAAGALALFRAARRVRAVAFSRALAALVLALVLAGAGMDALNFHAVFVRGQAKDLVLPLIGERSIFSRARGPA